MDQERQDDAAAASPIDSESIRKFLVVADELHFGRAAVRLSIAQPALSKAIQRMETRLGVPLFVRSSRHVELTPAGVALQEHGRHALNAVSAAVRSARRAADTQVRLRLVLKPGGDAGLLSPMLAEYALQPDARRVDLLFSGPADRTDFLRDGRADVGLLYAPFDDLEGLDHETLHTEDRVVIVPSGHRLAGRAAVRMSDLAGETLPPWKGVPGGDGAGPEVSDVVQLFHLITVSRMIAVLPRSLVEPAPASLVCIPVTDAPPSRLVIAWNEQDRRPLVASFVAAALRARRTYPRALRRYPPPYYFPWVTTENRDRHGPSGAARLTVMLARPGPGMQSPAKCARRLVPAIARAASKPRSTAELGRHCAARRFPSGYRSAGSRPRHTSGQPLREPLPRPRKGPGGRSSPRSRRAARMPSPGR